MRRGNSRNEMNRGGQMVLFGDGHAEFCANPFCGTRRDNIYTVSGSADGHVTTSSVIVGSPSWSGDSILLPVATVDPKGLEAPSDREARIQWQKQLIAWIFASAAGLVAICWYLHRRRRGRRTAPC
jgi:prepilin-type processing-associated H-X9-DG protein